MATRVEDFHNDWKVGSGKGDGGLGGVYNLETYTPEV